MFGFKWKKDPLALPPPVKADISARMRADFARAVHGDYFRTLAFYTTPQARDESDTEWLEAYDIGGKGWAVKKTRLLIAPDGTLLEKHQMIADEGDMDFFDALKFMALYESHRLREEGALVGEDAARLRKELGMKHLRAFAEREGIIFDYDGHPHTTLSGVIVSEGIFERGAAEKARDAYNRKQNAYAEMLGIRLPMPDLQGWRENKTVLSRLSILIEDMELVYKDLTQFKSEDVVWSYHAALTGKWPKEMQDKYQSWFKAAHRLLGTQDAYYDSGDRHDLHFDQIVLAFNFHALVTVAATIRTHVKETCYCDDNCTDAQAEKFESLAQAVITSIGVDEKEAEMIVFTRVQQMVGDLHVKGGSLNNIGAIIDHTRAMRDHVRDVLGISCNDTPKPDAKKFWQTLAGLKPS